MLSIKNLDVNYGRIRAVRDVSLEVNKGEIVGLLGPNGAGKTTTLTAIAGQRKKITGTIELDGESLNNRASEEIVRAGVSLVPEGRHIFATLTVRENLIVGTSARRDRAGIDAEIERELERFPVLRRYFDSEAGKLSGGEQQQLAIARALVARPRLLLLDEPSLGLSPLLVDLVFDRIGELRADGLTILIVEQNANRILEFADRCYILRSGSLVAQAARGELSPDQLAEIYLGTKDPA